jgi:hypothetical protein
LDASPDGST